MCIYSLMYSTAFLNETHSERNKGKGGKKIRKEIEIKFLPPSTRDIIADKDETAIAQVRRIRPEKGQQFFPLVLKAMPKTGGDGNARLVQSFEHEISEEAVRYHYKVFHPPVEAEKLITP